MLQLFKLYPKDPNNQSKIAIAKQHPSADYVQVNIQGWRKILPNKKAMALQTKQPLAYQCTALDNHCIIEVTISVNYKVNERIVTTVLSTNPVTLTLQLRERSLYVMQPLQCRVSVDEFSIFLKAAVEENKFVLLSEAGRLESPVTQGIVAVDPFHGFAKADFSTFRNDFLNFYCKALKWIPKLRSNVCFLIFNSKTEQDMFLVALSECFVHSSDNQSQIKIIPATSSSPTKRSQRDKNQQIVMAKPSELSELQRNDKNEGSTSSLASNNRSVNKNKEKVKISQRLNLKRSYTKLSNHPNMTATVQPTSMNHKQSNGGQVKEVKRYLNIFGEQNGQDSLTRSNDQLLGSRNPDASMDLRNSFDQFEQRGCHQRNLAKNHKQAPRQLNNTEEDRLSNNSFKQKGQKPPLNLQEENAFLKSQNSELRRQIQMLSRKSDEASLLSKKYLNAVQQLNRTEEQKRAILEDKVRIESILFRELQEKEKLKKQLQIAKMTQGPTKILTQRF